MKRILITGGTGFAGSHLVEHLLANPTDEAQILHVTHFGNRLPKMFDSFGVDQVHRVDLQNAQLVHDLLQAVQPTEIYHLAAIASVASSYSRAALVIQNNTSVQLNLLESMQRFAPEARLLVIGSAEEYGISLPNELPITEEHPLRPINPYAVSKVTQDLLAYSYFISSKLNIVRVRPFNHTGERQTTDFVIPSFISQIVKIERAEQTRLYVGNLDVKRDISDVKDVVAAYQVVMEKGDAGAVYNIGSGQSVSMRDVLDTLVSMATIPIDIQVDEAKVRPMDIPDMVADISKMKEIGWIPMIERDETLKRVLHWWRAQPSSKKD